LIGHLQHNLRDPSRDHSHGRIWRVTHKERPLVKPPKIAGATIAELLPLLNAPEDRTLYNVRRELAERSKDDVIRETKEWIAKLDTQAEDYERMLLEALWVHQAQNIIDSDLLKKLLDAKDHRVRAAAVRALSFWIDRVDAPLQLLKPRVNDSHPRVRLEAVRALSFSKGEKAIELALEVLEHEMDDYLQYTLDETMRALEGT